MDSNLYMNHCKDQAVLEFMLMNCKIAAFVPPRNDCDGYSSVYNFVNPYAFFANLCKMDGLVQSSLLNKN